MSEIDRALDRLESALNRAEAAMESIENGATPDGSELETLRAERDSLAMEVQALRNAAEEDARLRAEAAEAVKSALADLRGLVREGNVANA